ncbi:PIG-L family deacetylase [Nocardioides coralli]|uniref:PIG-L family deacetylase n=1 Tax=Nocardioides coralli TaxID=2872154 RepID=UPI001CA38B9E|nr:PIG-L family deacetylase [Nocardioides coralli]QZY29285.1 PIG-L family deacetylase [Nocardioides coralli]
MVTAPAFRHDAPGTPAQRWWHHPDRGRVAELDLVDADGGRLRHVVVVAAHPDDETMGAGGLLAQLAVMPEDVRPRLSVVLLTDGEASHPASPTHAPSALAEVRLAECREALDRLGAEIALVRRGLPDGEVAAAEDRCVADLCRLVGDGRGVLLLAPWRRDGHPDHEAAGRAAAAAAARTGARLLEYPVWFWHWGRPDDAPWSTMRRVSLPPDALAAKDRAIASHRSQVRGLSVQEGDEPLLGPDLLAHFLCPQELFVEEPGVDAALDRLHRERPEPWGAPTRWYEERKRQLVLAMLPDREHGRALDIGCSTGVLTEALADRCSHVLAVDSSPAAVRTARARLEGLAHVDVELRALPREWPPGRFDLVVVSEVGYFLSPRDLERLVVEVDACLADDGVVVLCHWRHPVAGWLLDGGDVHAAFEAGVGWPRLAAYRDDDVEILLLGPSSRMPEPTS